MINHLSRIVKQDCEQDNLITQYIFFSRLFQNSGQSDSISPVLIPETNLSIWTIAESGILIYNGDIVNLIPDRPSFQFIARGEYTAHICYKL